MSGALTHEEQCMITGLVIARSLRVVRSLCRCTQLSSHNPVSVSQHGLCLTNGGLAYKQSAEKWVAETLTAALTLLVTLHAACET